MTIRRSRLPSQFYAGEVIAPSKPNDRRIDKQRSASIALASRLSANLRETVAIRTWWGGLGNSIHRSQRGAPLFRRPGGSKGRYGKFFATGFALRSQAFGHARDLHRANIKFQPPPSTSYVMTAVISPTRSGSRPRSSRYSAPSIATSAWASSPTTQLQ
jgi:hypothetical protein